MVDDISVELHSPCDWGQINDPRYRKSGKVSVLSRIRNWTGVVAVGGDMIESSYTGEHLTPYSTGKKNWTVLSKECY